MRLVAENDNGKANQLAACRVPADALIYAHLPTEDGFMVLRSKLVWVAPTTCLPALDLIAAIPHPQAPNFSSRTEGPTYAQPKRKPSHLSVVK